MTIQEEMDEIDDKVKELEKIESANYRVPNVEFYLDQYSDVFAALDRQLGATK